jgi:hypothetical protein
MTAAAVGPGVYLLCALTSMACAALMGRSYRRSRQALLLWTGLCFGGLAVNSVLVIMDEVIFTTTDLRTWRAGSAVLAVAVLLFGLIWRDEP